MIILTDFRGRCILERRPSGTMLNGVAVHLNPGIYIFRLISGNQIYSCKFLAR
jgi:hypothetical protein